MNVLCYTRARAQPLANDVCSDLYWLECIACAEAVQVVSPKLRALRQVTARSLSRYSPPASARRDPNFGIPMVRMEGQAIRDCRRT